MNPIKLHLCQAANSQERCYTIQSEIGDWSPTSSVCTCVECYKFILVWNKWNLDLRCYDHFKKNLLWNNLIIKHCCIILSTLLNLYRINLILTEQSCLIIGSASDDCSELNHLKPVKYCSGMNDKCTGFTETQTAPPAGHWPTVHEVCGTL